MARVPQGRPPIRWAPCEGTGVFVVTNVLSVVFGTKTRCVEENERFVVVRGWCGRDCGDVQRHEQEESEEKKGEGQCEGNHCCCERRSRSGEPIHD